MKLRIFRWVVAIGAWIFGVYEFKGVLESEGGLAGFPPLLFGFAAFIGGLVLVSPEIVTPVASFFGDMFVSVIYPGARADRPPLSYILAHRYRDQNRYSESIAEYEKIIHYYPHEKDAYLELLQLAGELGDERTFRKYSRRFARHFKQLPNASDPRLSFW